MEVYRQGAQEEYKNTEAPIIFSVIYFTDTISSPCTVSAGVMAVDLVIIGDAVITS